MLDSPSSSVTDGAVSQTLGTYVMSGPGLDGAPRPLLSSAPIEQPDFEHADAVEDRGQYSVRLDCPAIDASLVRGVRFLVNGDVAGILFQDASKRHLAGSVLFQSTGEAAGQPFNLLYDAVYVSFLVSFSDGRDDEELFSQMYLCGTSEPLDGASLQNMISGIFELDDADVRSWMYLDEAEASSHRKALMRSSRRGKAYRSLSAYVSLVEAAAACLKANYPYFRTKGRHAIVKTTGLQPYGEVKTVTPAGFQWLMQNTGELCPVDGPGGVEYADQRYLPLRMRTEIATKSWDTYENEVVSGFLDAILLDADRVRRQMEALLASDEMRAVPRPESVRVPLVAMHLLHQSLLRMLLDALGSAVESLRSLQGRYRAMFGIDSKPLAAMPERTRTFQEVKPYAQVFETLVSWFRFGEVAADDESTLLSMWTADRIFEYYCLVRLLTLLKANGYAADGVNPSTRWTYGQEGTSATGQIANTYWLRRGDVRATLYYEPVVSGAAFENGLGLYRMSGNGAGYYRPDFVLRFESAAGEERYVVFDAKFATRGTIRQHLLPDVLRKYVLDMAAETPKGCADMVWVLQGRPEAPGGDPTWEQGASPLARASRFGGAVSLGIADVSGVSDAMPLLWDKMRERIPWI